MSEQLSILDLASRFDREMNGRVNYLGEESGREWRVFLNLLIDSSDLKVNPDIFIASDTQALSNREGTVLKIIESNPCYFGQARIGGDENNRTIRVFQRRVLSFLLERGCWMQAVKFGARWRLLNLANILLPKLLASVFVGAIAVLGASELFAAFCVASSSQLFVAGIALVIYLYFLGFEFARLKPRPSGYSLILRSAWPTLLGFLYAALVFLGANHLGMVDVVVKAGSQSFEHNDPRLQTAFVLSSLLIGTFVQVFWDKETVSKPM